MRSSWKSRWMRSPLATIAPEPASGYGAALIVAASAIGALLVAIGRFGWSPSPLTWYLARSSGIALYGLLFVSYMLGLALAIGWPRGAGRAQAHALHGFAIALSWGFLGLHLLSLAADPTVGFGPRQLFVPFAAGWREPWTAFGILAMYLLVLIGLSVTVRRAMGYPFWKAIHWLTYPLFLLALAHGLGSGSDAGTRWGQDLYLVTGMAAAGLTLYRVVRGDWRKRLPEPGLPGAPRARRAV